MNFITWVDLRLRKTLLNAYCFFAPLICRTGISKFRLGEYTLGYRFRLFFNKVINFKPAEPIEAHGMTLYHRTRDERGAWGWCYAFEYEPQTYRVFMNIVKPGMNVVDAGAHIGYYTLLAAKSIGKNGKVYAFEPDPEYFALLNKNIKVNNVSAIVEPFRLAVGDTEKTATLFLGKSTGTSLFKVPDTTDKTTIIDVVSLDGFFKCRNWPHIDLMKMDIEGAEKIALAGMSELIKRNPKVKLIIELNPSFLKIAGESVNDFFTIIGLLGFNRISFLSGEMKYYKLPQDALLLKTLADKFSFINLLCERYFEDL